MDSVSTQGEKDVGYEPRQAWRNMHKRNPELELFVKELNASFYQNVSKSFSQSRLRPWDGWERILGEIKDEFFSQNGKGATNSLSVIDFGCGNGRFGSFLEHALSSPLHYVGIDNNATLLEEAKNKLPNQTFCRTDITCSQEVKRALGITSFDISACFGVLHHLYGPEARAELVAEAIAALKSPGFACLSFWQPLNNAKYRERSQNITAHLQQDMPHIPFELFGTQDLFLSWQDRTDAIRYVHSFTEREIVEFLASVTSNFADVKIRCIFKTNTGNDMNNTYAILQKG